MFQYNARAQFLLQPQNYLSPEVASLVSEVQNPVSLSSGTMAINIPLFVIKEGSINVPVSLNYDASGVRVNSLASWVGQNWNLKAGGSISRVIKGISDESLYSYYLYLFASGDNQRSYYEDPGYFWHRHKLNNSLWESASQITTWAKDNGEKTTYTGELEPDEFIFNFCGHSGKFYMDHNGAFKVVGEPGYNIKCLLIDMYPQDFDEYDSSDYTCYIEYMLGNIPGIKRICSDDFQSPIQAKWMQSRVRHIVFITIWTS